MRAEQSSALQRRFAQAARFATHERLDREAVFARACERPWSAELCSALTLRLRFSIGSEKKSANNELKSILLIETCILSKNRLD